MFGGITRPIRGIDVAEKDNLSQLGEYIRYALTV